MTQPSTTITDARGTGYSANIIVIFRGSPYYCGYPISKIEKSQKAGCLNLYNIISFGFITGEICLDAREAEKITQAITKKDLMA